MSDKNLDCNLVATLRTISFFFVREKHVKEMLNNPYYRQNIELLQKKEYILIEDDFLMVTEAGNELMKNCRQ
jgi:hypothetical protein